MKTFDQLLLLGSIGLPTSHAMGWVGFILQWAGLGWVDENGPMSNSDPSVTVLRHHGFDGVTPVR